MFLTPVLTKPQLFAQTGYLYLFYNSENKQVLFSSAELTYLYLYWRIGVSLCEIQNVILNVILVASSMKVNIVSLYSTTHA